MSLALISGITSGEERDAPPLCVAPLEFDAVEDEPLTIDFAEPLSPHGLSTENASINSTSLYVVEIDGLNVTFLFPDGVLEANVPLVVWDGTSNYTVLVLFTIEPVNDPPRWDPRYDRLPDGERDSFYSFNLSAVDEDNEPDELTFSTDAQFFTMINGEIAFIPRNHMVGYNFFNVTVSDPGGLNDTMEVLLFVEPYPEWTVEYIPPQVVREDETWTLDISAYLFYNFGSTPPHLRLTFTYSDDSTKIWTNAETGVVTWTPTNADVGGRFFTITITDSEGRTDQQEIKITVEDPGPAPDPSVPPQVLTQGVRYVYQVPIDDWYSDHPEFQEEIEFDNEPTDLFRVDPYDGIIDFVPSNEDVGEWNVDIIVTDSFGLRSTRTVKFTVLNANDPPSLVGIPTMLVTEGETISFTLDAHDPDMDPRRVEPSMPVDPEENLTFSGGPAGSYLDPVTGEFHFVPDQSHVNASPFEFSFTVEDAYGESDTVTLRFHVRDVVMEPRVQILGYIDGQKLAHGKRYTFVASSVDESGEPWAERYEWYVRTEMIGTGADVNWRPGKIGWYEITLIGRDGNGTRAECSINVSVSDGGPHGPRYDLRPFVMLVLAMMLLGSIYVTFRMITSQRMWEKRRGRR